MQYDTPLYSKKSVFNNKNFIFSVNYFVSLSYTIQYINPYHSVHFNREYSTSSYIQQVVDNIGSHISDHRDDVITMKSSLLSGEYLFSPLRCIGYPHYTSLPGSDVDNAVFLSLNNVLTNVYLNNIPRFGKNYFDIHKKEDFDRLVHEMQTNDKYFCIECFESYSHFSRKRILEQWSDLCYQDNEIVNLISSILNLAVIDKENKNITKKKGIPKIQPLIGILSDVYLIDFDKKMREKAPHIKYYRFWTIMMYPILSPSLYFSYKKEIEDIFYECSIYNYRFTVNEYISNK